MLRCSLQACAFLVLVVALGKTSGQAAREGLQCVTLNDVKKTPVCTGSNAAYQKLQSAARQNGSIQVRPQAREMVPSCRSNPSCGNFMITFNPTLLKNKDGQDRFIYHDDRFLHITAIRYYVCRDSTYSCLDESRSPNRCSQLYRDYKLLAYYPSFSNSLPFLDTFSIPDCCGCG